MAREAGVELRMGQEETQKHQLNPDDGTADVDIAVVLGGDGTMLRALNRFLGTGVPVIGVNFGRVGFLASIPRDELEAGLARVFAGEYRVEELPTLEVEVGDEQRVAVNDLVVASGVSAGWSSSNGRSAARSSAGSAATGSSARRRSGSTGYNLSNGGPVLIWGLDAMAVTFVAPHTLRARPLVVPRGAELIVWNRTPDVGRDRARRRHRVPTAVPEGAPWPESASSARSSRRFPR